MAEYVTARQKLVNLCRAQQWPQALKMAAAWPELGEHKSAIKQGWAAHSNPRFYQEIGKDPEELVSLGIAALAARYQPPGETWVLPK